ncbi:MAG: FAD-dependent 5-carboxymethylaminomethyl-2-thiouridine(34) oxidoreductase MnmC [Limnobacter sp.]|nr:FAD-dependent 5-carboxymethylaminomethyl-2-thiouridine(34) oxidoreductase MnmC [Limnobacter sp.]
MNRYQAISNAPAFQPSVQQPEELTPALALTQAYDTWSKRLPWQQNSACADQFVLIDAMGNGVQFLSLLQLWHETQADSRSQNSASPQPQLNVYALDLNPWSLESLRCFWLNGSDGSDALDWMLRHWPAATPGLHCIQFQPWRCTLWLWFGDQERGLMQLTGHLDAAQLKLKLTPKPQRHLDCLLQAKPLHTPRAVAFSIAVVGAGIAGTCTAKALCDQGFEVHLLDAADGPAAGASGNWVGAFHPHITRDDTPLSQLTRLGCEFSLQALESLTRQGLLVKGMDWDTPGHLQTIPPDEVQRTQGTLAQLQFPDNVVQWAEPFSKMETPLHGLFFPQGAWAKPARWVQANIKACGPRLKVHYGCKVKDLSTLHVQLGQHVDAVVVACAQESFAVAMLNPGNSNSVKGQITRMQKSEQAANNIPHVASGESYAIAPPAETWVLLGATYERPVGELMPTEASDALNIARFQAAFPTLRLGQHVDSRCAVRFVWPDRLPVVGPVVSSVVGAELGVMQGKPTVYLNTAYASRGLTWAALAAHQVASSIRKQAGLCNDTWEMQLTRRLNPRTKLPASAP